MPEFPEVFTITRDLKTVLKGTTIKEVLPAKDYNLLPSTKKFVETIEGTIVQDVHQIAKNIIIKTNKGYINIHLAMTGQILMKKTPKKLKWERVTFRIIAKDKEFFMAFRDMRIFGKVRLLDEADYEKLKNKYGPEPLSKNLTQTKLNQIIKSKRTSIKNILMEQDKIGGLGNIYATEALFRAGIHPETRTPQVTQDQVKRLLEAIKAVIEEGIENRGSTLEDEMFVDIFGKKGKQQTNFKIYGKQQCPNCKTRIEKVKISGRNTYFCPECQKRTDQEIIKGEKEASPKLPYEN